MSAEVELAIVGAGPAGLGAATAAAAHGVDVLVLDEQPAPGGQVYRNLETVSRDRPEQIDLLGADYRRGMPMIAEFRNSAAGYAPETAVWDINGDGSLGVLQAGGARLIRARRVLIACGAMERPVPLPGWTLPGVMTVGAVQTLLKASAIVPDVPTVLAGDGPLLYLVAWQLMQAGAPIAAILATAPPAQRWRALAALPGAIGGLGQLRKGLAWQATLRRQRIPIYRAVTDLQVEGRDRFEAVRFRWRGTERRLDAGLLAVHEGVVPNLQLTRAAGCGHRWHRRRRLERTECGKDDEDARNHGQLLKELIRGPVEARRVEGIDRGLLVQSEEPQERHIPPRGIPCEGTPRTELAQGNGQTHRGRIHIG